MKNFTIDVRADGVAIARFDVPNRSMNTITFDVQEDLAELAETLTKDDRIVGLVIVSGKESGFCAGADLIEMESAITDWREASTQDELKAGVESAGRYSQRLRAFETAGKPIAFVLAGVALGGGLEFALAGHRRIATGDPGRLRLGLPEVTIGLMPGAGATQRLPRLAGFERAVPFLISGAPIDLETALQIGVVHDHVASPDDALATACAWVLDNRQASQPWDANGFRLPGGVHTPAGYAKFPYFLAHSVGDGPNDHAARANILRAVYEGAMVPIDAGLRIESRYFFNTVRAPSSGAMVRTLFQHKQALAKTERRDPAPFIERLRSAWHDGIGALVAEGESRRFVLGVSRALSPALTPEEAVAGPASVHPSEDAHLSRLSNFLLEASAREAAACCEDGTVVTREEADLRAIEAGYPAYTGGPISYLEAKVRARRTEIERRLDAVVSDGDLAILMGELRSSGSKDALR
jgi:3-hydroxyacyl-CoA dehydrogenase/enoyl-CoA hydratase/3-hydroxybutyryl-CoA epimerase